MAGVLHQCLGATGSGLRVFRAGETIKLWPLKVSCTVCEEHNWYPNCVHHGNEVAPLLESVLACPT